MSFLNGDERITGTEATIQQFWQWSASRLLDNTLRGIFAEWLVGLALDCLDEPREEWAAHDLKTKDGVTIEVKSSALYQTWTQNEKQSRPIFRIAKTRAWTPENGFEETAKRQSHVYVFALFEGKTSRDVLQLKHWTFYVVSTSTLDTKLPTQASLGMATLETVAGKPVHFEALAATVEKLASKKAPA